MARSSGLGKSIPVVKSVISLPVLCTSVIYSHVTCLCCPVISTIKVFMSGVVDHPALPSCSVHRYAKKQVLDESGTLSNLLQLWQLVVRHPDVIYESRAQFMSQMINTLSRIGMPQQASLENRKLSLDLAGLLLAWEAKRRQSAAPSGLPAAPAAAAANEQHSEGMHGGMTTAARSYLSCHLHDCKVCPFDLQQTARVLPVVMHLHHNPQVGLADESLNELQDQCSYIFLVTYACRWYQAYETRA